MQKFKELSTRGKIEHIWYYYKWHIIIGIFAIALIVNLVQDIIHRDESLPLFTISLQGYSPDHDKISDLEKTLTEQIKKTDEDLDKDVRIDFYSMNAENNDEYSMANFQKFMMMAMVGDLDIVCLDEEMFMKQAEMGYYKPLDSVPALMPLLERDQTKPIKINTEENPEEHIYGLRVDDLKAFENLGYDSKGKIIGIAGNTKKLSYSIDCLKLLFEE